MIAAELVAALGITLRAHGPVEQRTACPKCDRGPGDDALGVNTETGAFHCFRCGWSGRAGVGETRTTQVVALIDDPAAIERKRERLRHIWSTAVPLDHPAAHAARRYLTARGLGEILSAPPQLLRAHQSLAYFEDGRVSHFPALLALLSGPSGEGITLHATYLRSDGTTKAPVRNPKKLLQVPVRGSTRGGAIRLYAPKHGVLGIAEGIENALALRILRGGIPVWSAFCAANLEQIHLPRGLHELNIAVDLDASGTGERAASALGERVAKWTTCPSVLLVRPTGAAPRDLADEVRAGTRTASFRGQDP